MTAQEKETSLKELEANLWETADSLRNESSLTSQMYYMPVLGIIFLRHATYRFQMVEKVLLEDPEWPKYKGVPRPVVPEDFEAKSAMFVPEKARYDYLLNLPGDQDICKAVNDAMTLIEDAKPILKGILPKTYSALGSDLLRGLLRNFADEKIPRLGDDAFGRIYEYFLGCFAPQVASDDGVFFTPKSIVRLIVNFLEPTKGTVIDPACGSGGMFVSSGDFVADHGGNANLALKFYGQEKTDTNGKICLMNMAVHGFDAEHIRYGEGANTFFHDANAMRGKCDYVMANPPFNCHGLKADSVTAGAAGRLPWGLPSVNKEGIVSNGNYLWIQYFYAYLKSTGKAGFVMAASAPDADGREQAIRENLLKTGHVDSMLSVGNNFFFTKSLPCTLWFFDKTKPESIEDEVLFLDMRGYFHVIDTTHNEWTPWQIRNISAIRWLWRGEKEKYTQLLADYKVAIAEADRIAKEAGDAAKLREEAAAVEAAKDKGWRQAKKELVLKAEKAEALAKAAGEIIAEQDWLVSKFGKNGKYKDVPGLCKAASRKEIEEKKFSLNPGAYVGVAPEQDDGVDFTTRMGEIRAELAARQKELDKLMKSIDANLKEMGL
jgi:type I restriction enzyme M protein